tara:strand:+ start:935 stop:2563 length:1629 start_codon:yes stop_codon:yes gene_type:complete
MKKHDYLPFFPYKSIRQSQSDAIDFVLERLVDKNKKFVVLEAGTGVGKSAIGVTVGRYISQTPVEDEKFKDGTYFLTTQKILQDQYEIDFGKTKGKMSSIKSSSNYQCTFHKRNTCQQSQQILRTTDRDSKFFKACTFNCKYKNAKNKFLESHESVTNFPYFLTEATFSGKIVPRNLLVIDEAHNIENELSKFIEVQVSERFCKSILGIRWPVQVHSQYQAFKWIKEVYFTKVKSKLSYFEKALEKIGVKERLKEFEKISRQHDILKSHVSKVETFLQIYDNQNWVFENIPAQYKSQRKFLFKPIDVSRYAHEYLFRLGNQILMMSATILDKDTFCRSLGVPQDDVEFLSLPTPFPASNRPIITCSVGHMNSRKIDETLPVLSHAVKEILNEHKDQKGIIHCHTFKIAKYLKSAIRDDRLLIHNSENREEVLKKHIKGKKPTVLLSPSMSEGVDLHGDLSRFQIICKIPYPYLGDKIVKKRMNKWKNWYPLQTAKLIVQAAGRSIRSVDDVAITYILDSDWDRFFRNNSHMFPSTFKEALVK